jgi:hypothetical protein
VGAAVSDPRNPQRVHAGAAADATGSAAARTGHLGCFQAEDPHLLPGFARCAAALFGLIHDPLETNVPVACGGVLVMPGDVLVGDAEGVVVVPAALAEEVAHAAVEQESLEVWALERVNAGDSILGLYSLSDDRRPDYEALAGGTRRRDLVAVALTLPRRCGLD